MRDGTGAYVSNGADFGGSYAWIDSRGNNLFFGTFRQSILNNGDPSYQLRCVGGGSCDSPTENMTKDTIGISVAGLWTKGRTVLLDNVLNNIDWNLQARPSGHVDAKLYQGDNGWIHVGSGRDNAADDAGHMPAGGVGNINFIDSIENKLNAFNSMRTSIPRDVAWWVSTGKSTDVVAFDDWLNPQVLISSDMVQTIEGDALEPNTSRVQNAATTRLFNPPAYGEIVGKGRIEPVALGGVRGKGFFSRAPMGIRYPIQSNGNNQLPEKDWYVGVFIDPRFSNDNQLRRLIEFPDGTAIDLLGLRQVVYNAGSNRQYNVTLPEPLKMASYTHLGFRIMHEGEIELFVDGVRINLWRRPVAWYDHFKIQGGNLWLGRGSQNTNGFAGWLDEFNVLASARQMNAEEFCNHASGSIVAVAAQTSEALQQKATKLPGLARDLINQALPADKRSDAYLCYTDNRSKDGWVDLNRLPQGISSLRQSLLFPEGPLSANVPRPDSLRNDFCLSCHQADGTGYLPDTLNLQALESLAIDAEDDPRRQPGQPHALIYGNIPAGLFGKNAPPYHEYADDGLYIDRLILGTQ
jgi:hypothetical protein